jgi:serine/threonine-protein kinase
MGVVYEGFDLSLSRKVAIKQMRPELAGSPRDRERFLSEARTVAKFQHPNIVAIHSILEDDRGAYLVFEFIEGESLDRMLQRVDRLAPEAALPLIKSVGKALDYAHRQMVIHRDLKPSNVMVGADEVVKVMDFGIAHVAKQSLSRISNVEAAGTMAYMPPEQEMGKTSKQADIFAFAALAFEVLMGEQAFPGPNYLQQKREACFTRPSRVSKVWPVKLDQLFERAFHIDPDKRPASAAEFVRALGGALKVQLT